jgi:2-methylcitrate dehydratase
LVYNINLGDRVLGYSKVFGSNKLVLSEKAIAANASAVREWDSNGTVFGYNPNIPGH